MIDLDWETPCLTFVYWHYRVIEKQWDAFMENKESSLYSSLKHIKGYYIEIYLFLFFFLYLQARSSNKKMEGDRKKKSWTIHNNNYTKINDNVLSWL